MSFQTEQITMKWTFRVVFIVSAALIWNALSWSGQAEDARWGRRPSQFYSQLPGDVRLGGAHVLAVAHNAGDDEAATSLAIAHGADVVEIDVMPIDGRLYAAHDAQPSWMPLSYRGPSLSQAWARTRSAQFVQLDLGDSSVSTLRLLETFLIKHDDGRRVFVSTRNYQALERLEETAPHVVRFLSIGNLSGLQALLDNPDRAKMINGVSIRADLLTLETTDWLKDRGLLIYAWTVNDVTKLNALVGLGVDAITTDNLAILDAMRVAERKRDAAAIGKLFP
jgi:glycerophosphoryl diester phosphodiesterase